MAEGWGKRLKSNQYNFYSAGTKKHGLNPRAVKVMSELGVDISDQTSKTIDELPECRMDYVFTVCSDAHESCPIFPGGKIVNVGFDDPPRVTQKMTDENEILGVYRRLRDEIKEFVINIENYIGDKS